MKSMERILLVLALTLALVSGHRRNLRTCECTCDQENSIGIILTDAELIVANGGEDKLCVPSEEAAEHFRDETAKCDYQCDYDVEEVEEAASSDVDLDALDF